MWVGTLIQKFNSVESEISYIIYPNKQKVLFETISKIQEEYNTNIEIPPVSLEYVFEDNENYFVYVNGQKESNLEELINDLSFNLYPSNSVVNFNFSIDEFKPYFLELSYNENFVTEGYDKKVYTAIESELKDIEKICLYFLSEIHYCLKDKKEYNTIEKCIKFLETFSERDLNRWGVDLNIKIKYYENNLFSLLKEYKIEDLSK